MKHKHLFMGIFSIGLIFMMVLAGCKYDGPSADEIADTVNGKLNDPSADEIAETVLEQIELRECSQYIENLTSFGKLTVTKGIQAWDQADAAFTLTINTAERASFYLPNVYNNTGFPYNTVEVLLAWEGTGNSDIKRSDYRISIMEKANGKTANFNFTFTNMITAKTIKGVLTVNTIYDHNTVGIDNLNEFFVKVLSSFDADDVTSKLTTDKPITNWGQNDVSYTITAENSVNVCFPTLKAPILYDNDFSPAWKSVLVEWKPLTVPTDLTSSSDTEDDSYVYIGNNYDEYYSYNKSILTLSTDYAAEKQVILNFRITNDDQTITGTVTVKIKKVTPTPPTAADLEEQDLKDLRKEFKINFEPYYHNYDSNFTARLTCYIENSITAFGQTDVSYLITVRGNTGYSDSDGSYSTLNLPSMSGGITWTTKTSDASVVLSGSSLKVYNDMNGIAEFNFTYTYSPTKTVKGTVKVTVVK